MNLDYTIIDYLSAIFSLLFTKGAEINNVRASSDQLNITNILKRLLVESFLTILIEKGKITEKAKLHSNNVGK